MAFRRRFSGSRPRTSQRRLPLRWIGSLDTDLVTVAADTLETQAIVVPADYQQSTGLEASAATIMRCRGWLNLVNGVTVPNVVLAALYVAHGDLGGRSPASYDQIFRYGGTLWFGSVILGAEGAAVAANHPRWLELDVKSKRKLENESLVLALFGQLGFTYTHAIRVLMKVT